MSRDNGRFRGGDNWVDGDLYNGYSDGYLTVSRVIPHNVCMQRLKNETSNTQS